MSCENRCGGACCRRFGLPNSTTAEREAKRLEVVAWLEHPGTEPEPWMRELLQVCEMLVPLETLETDGLETFTCKNLDTEAGLCRIYEERPTMCRNWPEDNPARTCGYCGYVAPPARP